MSERDPPEGVDGLVSPRRSVTDALYEPVRNFNHWGRVADCICEANTKKNIYRIRHKSQLNLKVLFLKQNTLLNNLQFFGIENLDF